MKKSFTYLIYNKSIIVYTALMLAVILTAGNAFWKSKFLSINKDGSITYFPDREGNTIPDFSNVGYHHGLKQIPEVKAIKVVKPVQGDATSIIQDAIDEVAALKPDKNGFRGAILLKKGTYSVAGNISIKTSGIVLRGEGNGENGTRIIAAGKGQRSLIKVTGNGKITEIKNTRVNITGDVPTGDKSFEVSSAKGFKPGDRIIVFRPGTENWIHDLQMDQIVAREGTKQWTAKDYNLNYERKITKIDGNKVFIDNPIVMRMDKKYGGGEIFKYEYNDRLAENGIEEIRFESEYASEEDEDHGWIAVEFDDIENGWIRNVSAYFFGYSCVTLRSGAKNITVTDSRCFDAKSIITGGRRYSFNNEGQQNLFLNLETTEGRHDYVTGARVCGPNVFYNCKARKTHADIGPHHRWATGTLYDNIDTDGEINVQDRGNWGSGHGWAGVTQVLWNCRVSGAAVQSPWVSGKNYVIGLQGKKLRGRLDGRENGEWEGLNTSGLEPSSLFIAQLKARKL